MPALPVARRLSAIVVADVAGYSRLMERNESGTHARLLALREQVIDPQIAAHGGRVVKTTGDGFLLEFSTAGAALRFAVDAQRAVAAHNRDVASEARIELRMGINVGDIIVDGNDVAGDGVNVAARLETLAEPGGICVTAAVRDQVHDDLDVGFIDIGEQFVKNIQRPIHVYRVRLDRAVGTGAPRAWRWRWPVAAVAGAGAIVAIAWLLLQVRVATPTSPPAMSVAVMPFVATGGTAADEQLADALTRDLGTGLARGSQAVVVASPGTVAAYKGGTIDARAAGRELNVRYVVEGEVRRTGERRVVSVQLVDAGTASQVWAERVELEAGDPISDETAFSRRLTAKLRGALFNAEYRRAASGSAQGTSPAELVWRAMSVAGTGTPEATRDAGKLLDKAIALEPRLVPALTNRALNLVYETEIDPRVDYARLLRQADDLSSRAVAIDSDDAYAWMTRAVVLGFGGQIEQALAAIALARRLDPTRKTPVVWHAWIMLIAGEPDKSLALLDEARAVLPDEMALELRTACWANLDLGRYGEAAALCAKATAMDADYLSYALLAAAYANAGEPAKAAAAVTELRRLMPDFSVAVLSTKGYSTQSRYAEQAEAHLYAGLRKAGIPDGRATPAR